MNSILTVLQPAASRDLTTLAVVKEELGITDGKTDALLKRWISEVSNGIQSYMDRVLVQEKLRESIQFHPLTWGWQSERAVLKLARFPVTAIDSLSADGTDLVADTDYEFTTAGLVYRLNSEGRRATWSACNIVVEYWAGYPAGAPERLVFQEAALIWMKHRWSSRTRDPALRSYVVPGVLEETYWVGPTTPGSDPGVPAEVASKLDGFIEVKV